MRLDDLDPTENARDLGSGGSGGGFPLFALLPILFGRRMGCGTIVLLLAIGAVWVAMSGGGGLGGMLGSAGGGGQVAAPGGGGGQGAAACSTGERLEACRVMTSTEQVWGQIFQQAGRQYKPATINFFTGGANSRCGFASSAVGPFYCPADEGVYLDTAFFDELASRFGAQGDAARAYVIAHEIGHHIQNLLGTSEQVSRMQAKSSETESNALSVRLELQADCFAGVWATRSGRLEPGDIEEGMTAANAIGDDTLQKQAQGRVVPDSFTHGTSEQRMKWLKRGLDSGDPGQCDTFKGDI
ncbi:neutral zinc metallopeptidase [Sphingomonas canadensis]|uniref:Neutral zinc metallopeptidase n=1 Tax=Sphingomonas canadensis TaxID=1219257 RepID=A0ABW3H4D2_9SPHN|nr:neutral zinc metallopeptidase [Sphingomonas canadensis]MCW3835879.1 zinc metallopeptidase [Sphingomonas canadensis]